MKARRTPPKKNIRAMFTKLARERKARGEESLTKKIVRWRKETMNQTPR